MSTMHDSDTPVARNWRPYLGYKSSSVNPRTAALLRRRRSELEHQADPARETMPVS